VTGFSDQDTDPPGLIKGGEFLDRMRDY